MAHDVVMTDIAAFDNGLPGIYHKNTKGSVTTNATITNDNINIVNDTQQPWVVDNLESAP